MRGGRIVQTAQDGGEFGFFEKGKLAKELEDVLGKLSKGQVTDVIKVTDGLMIFKIEDKHSGGILSFELAQDEIKNKIYGQRMQPKIRDYLTKLRNDGYVELAPGYVDSGAAPKQAAANDGSSKQ